MIALSVISVYLYHLATIFLINVLQDWRSEGEDFGVKMSPRAFKTDKMRTKQPCI